MTPTIPDLLKRAPFESRDAMPLAFQCADYDDLKELAYDILEHIERGGMNDHYTVRTNSAEMTVTVERN